MKSFRKKIHQLLFLFVMSTLSLTSCKREVKETFVSDEKDTNLEDEKQKQIGRDSSLQYRAIAQVKKVKKLKTYQKNTYGYVTKQVYLRKDMENTKTKSKINLYQKVKLLGHDEDWVLVKYNHKEGYIKKKNVKKIKDEFIDVDISDQKLTYYDQNGSVSIKSDIVTGIPNKERETILGFYSLYSKEENRHLVKYDAFVKYWMPFFGGYGLHDASWRDKFGGEIYKTNGSHGCVNLPSDVAKKVYEKSKIGTKVLIHK